MRRIKKYYQKIFSEGQRLAMHRISKRTKSYLMKGNAFYCNCCSKSFSAFLQKTNGIDVRNNAECPYCGSLERTRVLLDYLKKETTLFSKQSSLLHIAPEDALKKIFKETQVISYTNGDINENLADEIIDITAINYPENYFDFIICSHVLGHIPDEAKAIDELLRVLKPNGKAFLLTPISHHITTLEDSANRTAEQRLNAYGEFDLLRLHGQDFPERLARSSWTIERLDYRMCIDEPLRVKLSVGDGYRELIFVGTKH